MGAGCACHVPTPLAGAISGSSPAAAFVSPSTGRGPPVLPWGQLDPGRGRPGRGILTVRPRIDATATRSIFGPRRSGVVQRPGAPKGRHRRGQRGTQG